MESAPPSNHFNVTSQKICLLVDVDDRKIQGFTELVIPSSSELESVKKIFLHARGIQISRIVTDNLTSQFELQSQRATLERVSLEPDSVEAVAEVIQKEYISELESHVNPELIVHIPPEIVSSSKEQENEPKTIKVRIEYSVQNPVAGIHFAGQYAYTNSSLRKSRYWFPCVDNPFQISSFELEITVKQGLTAVCSGDLVQRVSRGSKQELVTFVYRSSVPISAEQVVMAIGPVLPLPDAHVQGLIHYSEESCQELVKSTAGGLNSAFSMFEDYLGAPFPFPAYKQVFIPEEAAMSCSLHGASVTVFSSALLTRSNCIAQGMVARVKQAHALARQWFGVFILPESPEDEWLLEGLAGYLLHLYLRHTFGNNEASFRRSKENAMVCMADIHGAPPLTLDIKSNPFLHGIHKLDATKKLHRYKSLAVIEMLEKQMGAESFRKVLQRIISRAQAPETVSRLYSTREFRHAANKLGNLERPFLKDFFPRWVETPGCPRVKMGFSFVRRRTLLEIAVTRESTDSVPDLPESTAGSEREWVGMMTVRVHETEGTYDHSSVALGGDSWQLLEVPCHTKVSALRKTGVKRGASKAEASQPGDDDAMAEGMQAMEASKGSQEIPVQWIRVDPEREYLTELQLHQPAAMWASQLEKERDVCAQSQAVEALSRMKCFTAVNALLACLSNHKVFWRVRSEAALGLASCSPESNALVGMSSLLRYYQDRWFDKQSSLPRPNDFRNWAEYFVNQALVSAVAKCRSVDGFSPPEAIEFILSLLKHNNNGSNPFDDSHWIAVVVEAAGTVLPHPQKHPSLTASLVKQLHRYLQFDELVPSPGHVISCAVIRSLTQISLRPPSTEMERIKLGAMLERLLGKRSKRPLQVRLAAMKCLLDLQLAKGEGPGVILQCMLQLLTKESNQLAQRKVVSHVGAMCRLHFGLRRQKVPSTVLAAMVALFRSRESDNNVGFRHAVFSVAQALADNSGSLYLICRQMHGQAEAEEKNLTVRIKGVKPQLPPHSQHLPFPPLLPQPLTPAQRQNLKVKLPARLLGGMKDSTANKGPVTTASTAGTGPVKDFSHVKLPPTSSKRLSLTEPVSQAGSAGFPSKPPLAEDQKTREESIHPEVGAEQTSSEVKVKIAGESTPVPSAHDTAATSTQLLQPTSVSSIDGSHSLGSVGVAASGVSLSHPGMDEVSNLDKVAREESAGGEESHGQLKENKKKKKKKKKKRQREDGADGKDSSKANETKEERKKRKEEKKRLKELKRANKKQKIDGEDTNK